MSLALKNMAHFGPLHDVEIVSPLLDRTFLSDVARCVPRRSFGDRPTILQRHFGDFLLEAVLTRRTKAEFGCSYFGRYTREFARDWDGKGVRADVDVAWLRNEWMTAKICHGGTAMLLQSAWLATHAPHAPNTQVATGLGG